MMIRKTNEPPESIYPPDPLDFLFSDETIDSYGDIIDVDGWILDDFERNPIALMGHDPNWVIGTWTDVRIENRALRGRLKLAPPGTSARTDEVSKLIKSKILRACSVGFLPLQAEPIPGSKRNGVRYRKSLLREVSIVSVPANANALAAKARAMGISDKTIREVTAQTVNATLAERQERARLSIQRAKAAIRRADAITGRGSVVAKREQLMEAARAKLRAKVADDPFSLRGLTDEEQKAVLRAKQEAPYAVPQFDNPWQEPPELFFNGKPIYPKKGPYGY